MLSTRKAGSPIALRGRTRDAQRPVFGTTTTPKGTGYPRLSKDALAAKTSFPYLLWSGVSLRTSPERHHTSRGFLLDCYDVAYTI